MSAIDLPRARRLAYGVVLAQAVVTLGMTAGGAALGGRLPAWSALAGGGIATAGSLAMAGLVFAPWAGADQQRALAVFYVGEGVKLAVIVALFMLVLKLMTVVPLALFGAFAATLLVYWLALLAVLPGVDGMRRGAADVQRTAD